MKDLVIATRNRNKVKEIKILLNDLPLNVIALDEGNWSVPEIVEDGKDFKENAVKKARVVAKITGQLTLADDSGLEVDALEGQPGIFSSRFAGEKATDRENNLKLLELLKNVPLDLRTAQFCCVIAIVDKKGKPKTVEGLCAGRIAFQEQGSIGFGYDPLFVPNNYDVTFAQLGLGIKNKLSHRARALEKAKLVLEKKLLLDSKDG